MNYTGVNYLAIIVAAAAAFIFGGIYYRVLSKHWMAATGLNKKSVKKAHMPTLFAITILAELIMAWMLAGVLAHLGPGQVTIKNGMISGALLWLGFVMTTIAVNNGFGMRKPMLSVIDGGHWLGVLLVMGAVLGAFAI
jgi:hypothetical protein